ncbi:hypothetical protein NQZ68_040668, partial [Dissostichus eleginoides]
MSNDGWLIELNEDMDGLLKGPSWHKSGDQEVKESKVYGPAFLTQPAFETMGGLMSQVEMFSLKPFDTHLAHKRRLSVSDAFSLRGQERDVAWFERGLGADTNERLHAERWKVKTGEVVGRYEQGSKGLDEKVTTQRSFDE